MTTFISEDDINHWLTNEIDEVPRTIHALDNISNIITSYADTGTAPTYLTPLNTVSNDNYYLIIKELKLINERLERIEKSIQ